jgi:putative ABC transport system permease protein
MILGIYVLEVMMLALALGISGVSSAQVDHTTALLASGASLQVRSDPASPISPTAIAALPGVATVTPLQTTTADVALTSGGPTLRSAPLAGSTRNISGHGAPQLSKRDAAYPSDAAVYRALSSHADLIVVDVNFLGDVQSLGGPLGVGAHVALRNPTTGATRVVKIAGVQADVPDGAQVHEYVNPAVITAVAGAPASENLLFVDTKAGTDAHQLAASINARFASSGADALAFRDEANQILGTRGQYFNFLGVLVTVGILIGVFALGVVMIRSVRERRHEIGTIRAIGWTRQSVRRIFLAEAGFLATQGTVIGLCLGTVLAYRISAGTSVTQFVIPWVPLAIVGVLTIGASLLAAARPAAVAAHIPPAVALRSPE